MKRFLCKAAILFFMAGIFAQQRIPGIVFSQNLDDEKDSEYEEDGNYDEDNIYFEYESTMEGDQNIRLSLGAIAPLNFPDISTQFTGEPQLNIGGIGFIGYHYFMTSKFSLGFDVGFGFNTTIGSHIFNYVPFLLSGTYQLVAGKFEFPFTLNIGFGWESYNGNNYFPGLVVKPEIGVQYRLTESWSFGLDASYMFMPEFAAWYDSNAKNYYGHFAILSLSAKYIF